jgi:hypothetical protein
MVDEAVSHASDSAVQRAAEAVMMQMLSERLGVVLTPATIRLDDGTRVELDGADTERTVLVESWARFGRPKPAHHKKVLTDALKLSWIAGHFLPRPARLVLLMADQAAAYPFTGGSGWGAHAIADLGVEVVVVELPPELAATIIAAQARQFR